MEYIYYDPITKQVEAVFNTPFLSAQTSWEAKGLTRAIIPPGMDLATPDFKVDAVTTKDGIQVVERYSVSQHPKING